MLASLLACFFSCILCLVQAIPGGDRFSDEKLLNLVRFTIIPITLIACIVASEYNQTGYLLIVAFDIVLAGCIAPLFAAIYFKKTVRERGTRESCTSSVARTLHPKAHSVL